MAEYYAVLKKAIGGLNGNAADGRRAVYDKARNALIGQLKAVDPPLTTAEISRQRLELEEAIRKVEREAAAAATSAPVARPANPPPALPRVEPSPAEMPVDGPTPQDVFRRAIQDAEQRGHAAAAIERAAPPPPQQYRADAGYGGATADTRAPRDRVERVASPPPQAPPREEDYRRPERDYRQPEAEYRPEPVDYDARSRPAAEPRLAPDYNQDWDPPLQPQAPPTPPPQPAPFVDSRDRPVFSKKRKRGYLEEGDRELYEKPARPSRLPTVLLFVLIIAVVGGLGAIAYSQRDWLNAVVADLSRIFESGPTTPAPQPAPAPAPPADAAAASKNPDRLLEGGAPAPDVRVVSPQAPDAVGPPRPEAQPEPAPDTAAAEPLPPLPAAPAEAPATGDALVAQKAILYEEPTDAGAAAGGVTAIKAAVTWRFIESGPNGPEIEASLQVPERNMKIRFSIHRNTDASLPASHLIEVVVDTPADFPGKAIQSVPRVVLKLSEEARGEPLIGAQAKITNGFFWIALSAAEQDVESNLALIRDRNWIDLPFVYDTGQRAILTFEKGTPGERVFEKAVAAWGG